MAGGRGTLVLVGTPIGNREDLSPRARRTILEADMLLCEDTRSPRRLLGEGVELPPRHSCFVANEHERVALMLEQLEVGRTVAYVTEAGLPLWSDPGRLLIRAAVEAGHDVDVVPGPTAAATALCHSGFEAQNARFCGFLPRSGSARKSQLESLVTEVGATILYEAGNRAPATLRDLAELVPERELVIARELTKLHQEVLRGTVRKLADHITEPLRGEVTMVIGGAEANAEQDDPRQAALAAFEAMLDPALKPRERAKRLAALTGLEPNDVYDRLVGKTAKT